MSKPTTYATAIVHYSGGIQTNWMKCLPGWPCCCTGDRAFAIERRGNQTEDCRKVTCKRCLYLLEKHDEFAKET